MPQIVALGEGMVDLYARGRLGGGRGAGDNLPPREAVRAVLQSLPPLTPGEEGGC